MSKILLLFSLALVFAACKEHVADNAAASRPPSTFLWLTPDSTVGVGVSKQHLHWYAEDPDGRIRGYLLGFAVTNDNLTAAPFPDTLGYTWLTANDTTLLFPLDTLFRKFVVVVRGVDDGFEGLPVGSRVRLGQSPYWDKNNNGMFDGGDAALPTLAAAMDPRGAVLTFPIRNTPPSVLFAPNPADPSQTMKQPDTTYTAATFAFTASDPDGNNTLVSFRIALNDTSAPSSWLAVPLRDTVVTLVVPRQRSDAAGPGGTVAADVYAGTFNGRQLIGQVQGLQLDGLNKFFVEVKDVAGEYSPAATLPSGTDRWYVKRPVSPILLVSDYVNSDAEAARTTYMASLAAAGFPSVDRLNMGQGVTLADKNAGRVGTLVPNFVDPALIQTFLLYDYVVWYTDQYPSLGVAQQSLFTYMQNGGKVLFSTSFLNTVDPRGALRDFAPIDSVSSINLSPYTPPGVGDTRIPPNYILYPDSTNPSDIYPQLAFNSLPGTQSHVIFMRPLYRRSDARYLYHLQADARVPQRYTGTPNLAVVDGQNTIVFVGVPLHLLNNTVYGQGLTAFFKKAFSQYSPAQAVNRAVF